MALGRRYDALLGGGTEPRGDAETFEAALQTFKVAFLRWHDVLPPGALDRNLEHKRPARNGCGKIPSRALGEPALRIMFGGLPPKDRLHARPRQTPQSRRGFDHFARALRKAATMSGKRCWMAGS